MIEPRLLSASPTCSDKVSIRTQLRARFTPSPTHTLSRPELCSLIVVQSTQSHIAERQIALATYEIKEILILTTDE